MTFLKEKPSSCVTLTLSRPGSLPDPTGRSPQSPSSKSPVSELAQSSPPFGTQELLLRAPNQHLAC